MRAVASCYQQCLLVLASHTSLSWFTQNKRHQDSSFTCTCRLSHAIDHPAEVGQAAGAEVVAPLVVAEVAVAAEGDSTLEAVAEAGAAAAAPQAIGRHRSR